MRLVAAINRSMVPTVTPPTWNCSGGSGLGNDCGLRVKPICTSWSSTKLIAMVASSGAIGGACCKGRRAKRSIKMPTSAQTEATTTKAASSGRFHQVMHTQPV